MSSAARVHSDWLSLVEITGPFLTLPVLRRALPHGLEPTDSDVVDGLRRAYAEYSDDATLHTQWVEWVLGGLLAFPDEVLRGGAAIGPSLTHRVPEHHVMLRPDYAVVQSEQHFTSPRLLVVVWPPGTRLDVPPTHDDRWSATPVDRMAELCRATGVRVGLVTNSDTWTLVDAPVGSATGTATWDAQLWLDERSTLDAFTTLVGVRRFFSVADGDTLEALLEESADAEAEVTDQLGRQVRAAVELLVDAMSRANRERNGELFADLTDIDIYTAAVTVMMRLVFLLSAEERGLFLLGDATYDTTYAVSTLRAQLEEEANTYGDDVLERRTDAWHRLLATFRMVHEGADHENLRLPAYGGSLFDPARFSFLEGRLEGDQWDAKYGLPIPIDNRTVLAILDALQVLRFSGRGGAKEARRLSFRALDVEQIGHVYEGLLDHSAVRVDAVALGFDGKKEAEIALQVVEDRTKEGQTHLVGRIAEETGLTVKQTAKRLDAEPEPDELERLVVACDNDHDLADRVAPWLGLLREDLRGLPVVFLPDSYYVTKSSDRRTSGTYYTPRALAEEMVLHALEPLVYEPGPASGAERDDWKLRASGELLGLKICDMAMGSGAFLVAVCRYLADRVLEAWAAEGHDGGSALVLPGGQEVVLPDDEGDRTILARRIVADRCLYGVDRNPMAVEMAKLSLWLVTLAKERPFSFLDHALRCGDSLLGITDLAQLEYLHLDPDRGRTLHGKIRFNFDPLAVITPLVKEAVDKRRALEAFTVVDIADAQRKADLSGEADALLRRLKIVGDVLVGAALSTATQPDASYDDRLAAIAPDVMAALDPDRSEADREGRMDDLGFRAAWWLNESKPAMAPDRECFHWPLEFPEVFLDRPAAGFDAVVGNPPFLGGQFITGALGSDFREHLVTAIGNDARGSADLVSYFFLRAAQVCRAFGLLATNTISQGVTREVGLDQLTEDGWTITGAVKSTKWPGESSPQVAKCWLRRNGWQGQAVLDGTPVSAITPSLDPASRVSGKPYRLAANANLSFQGSNVLGLGFTMSPEEAQALIAKDPMNADVLFPYLNGADLNSSPDQSAARWVINFFDWPIEKARKYPDCFAIVEKEVKPQRAQNRRKARRERWWQYAEVAPGMYSAIEGMDRVLVIARVSKAVLPLFVSTGTVFHEKIVVFPYSDNGRFALLSSAFHWWWTHTWTSTLGIQTS